MSVKREADEPDEFAQKIKDTVVCYVSHVLALSWHTRIILIWRGSAMTGTFSIPGVWRPDQGFERKAPRTGAGDL